MVEYGKVRKCGRIQQNIVEYGNVAEYGRIQKCGRIQQNMAEYRNVVKYSRIWQNIAECGNIVGDMPQHRHIS